MEDPQHPADEDEARIMQDLLNQRDENDDLAAEEGAEELFPAPPPDQLPVETFSPRRPSYKQISLFSTLALLWHVIRRSQLQWYSTIVYLQSSKLSLLVVSNACIAASLHFLDLAIAMVLGDLTMHESEGLRDFVRWNLTETCLALTLFRHELTPLTCLYFLRLILVQSFHHLLMLRIQHIRMTQEGVRTNERGNSYGIPREVLQVIGCTVAVGCIQIIWIYHHVQQIIQHGASVHILFAFETAIQIISSYSQLLLWCIHVLDGIFHHRHERQQEQDDNHQQHALFHFWKEHKSTFVFAIELQSELEQFLLYLLFFGIVMMYYGMPLNLFREVYVSFVRVRQRFNAFQKYRKLMTNMNQYKDVTEEQLDEAGRTCIICRDDMSVRDCKQLPICHHLFHKSCLREWLVQQQSCPTCRADICTNEHLERQREAVERAAQERAEAAEVAAGAVPDNHAPNDAFSTDPMPVPPILRSRKDKETKSLQPPLKDRTDADPLLVESVDVVYGFPALFLTVRGVSVWAEMNCENRRRNIPRDTLVLCLEYQVFREDRHLLRIPDGWIYADHVERVVTL